MRQVVYVDELLFVNMVMNLTVLWLTARFIGCKVSRTRMITTAAVGCIYALVIFWPGASWLGGFLAKLVVTAGMVALGFGYGQWRRFLQNFVCLLLISFSVGGLAAGLTYLWGSAFPWQGDASFHPLAYNKWVVLGTTVLLSVLLGHWGSSLWLKRVSQRTNQVLMAVTLWGKTISLQALVDTGNQLTDPLSQHPVVVVEYEALSPLLPQEICACLTPNRELDEAALLLSLSHTPYVNRLRLIPFVALGQEKGMLLGIRPDCIEIFHHNKAQPVKDVVVGISHQKLSPETTYRALLHPQLLAS